MLVSKLCDFWPQAVSSRFSNNQNHYFIDFWLGSWRLRGRKNVSVGHETSIPSIEKVSAVSFSSRGLFFSSIWTSLGEGSWALTFSSRGYTCFRPYRTFILSLWIQGGIVGWKRHSRKINVDIQTHNIMHFTDETLFLGIKILMSELLSYKYLAAS